jgi:hypothetical protein
MAAGDRRMERMTPAEIRAAQWDCQEAMITFYRGLDERDFDRLLSVMDPEGVWDREGTPLKSEGEIRAAMAARSKTMVIFHVLGSFQVTVRDHQSAELFAYMVCFGSDTGQPPVFPIAIKAPRSVYICRGEFRRRGDRWLITRNWTEGPFFIASN